MKQLQNGIYAPGIGERDWGEKVNQNFEVLDDLIKKSLETDNKCQAMADQIQANANEIDKVNDDLSDSLTSSTTNLQNQIDDLNNNTAALKNKVDNLTKIDNAVHSEEADVATLAHKANVAKKVENPLIIGNIMYDGSASETVPIDGQPIADSDNLVTSAGVYSALETKQNKATTIKGYNIADAYTKSEIDDMISNGDVDLKAYTDAKISGLVNSAPETLDTLNELASALGNDPNFAVTIAAQIGTKADTNHTHDNRYYTESEINTKLSGKSDIDHTHSNYLTGITKSMVTNALGYTPPASNTTYSAGTNLSLSDTTFNVSNTPSFTDITINGYKITID